MTVAPKIILRRCAVCDIHFEHGDGGACLGCERVFCARHLYPRIAFLIKRMRGSRPICGECRKEGKR